MELNNNYPACVLPPIENHKEVAERIGKSIRSTKKLALSEVPKLHSRLGATIIVYLNFIGQTVEPVTPAFDQDGDPTTFVEAEIESIKQIWAYVAEKYSIFDVDITTEKPEVKDQYQVVIGGDGSWMGGTVGGVANLGRMYAAPGEPITAFVFPPLLGNHPKYISDGVAHEIGHTFGLRHQIQVDETDTGIGEYDYGNAQVAPLMGCAYYSERAVWHKSSRQDDIFVLDRGCPDYSTGKLYQVKLLRDEGGK